MNALPFPRLGRWILIISLAHGLAAQAPSTEILPIPIDSSTWVLPTEPFTLKEGPGLELIRAHCLLCHSTEYISTQPPLKRGQWEAEVAKMRGKFGAPIATNAVPGIVEYLVANYGLVTPK